MDLMLSSHNFPSATDGEGATLESELQTILRDDYDNNLFAMLAGYQRMLADNHQRDLWPAIHDKLRTLFMCGKAVPLDGPMVGIPVSIRDSDFFRKLAQLAGESRSALAKLELLASTWNATFADTGLWMGKAFEPVDDAVFRDKCENDADVMTAYDPATSRIGRNFFRQLPESSPFQGISLPLLEEAWSLKERPLTVDAKGFEARLQSAHLEKERVIPYSKTGGIYLAQMAYSVLPEQQGKQVYQLNYRWPRLNPVFPMTLLIDELVQIGEGIYLGQLIYASKHISLGAIDLPLIPGERDIELGEPYAPHKHSIFDSIRALLGGHSKQQGPDYGYQNNGYFLLMDPSYAKQIYADDAFPQLRPRPGEIGFDELGYEAPVVATKTSEKWLNGWRDDEVLAQKFTHMITEPSTRADDADVSQMRQVGESVLQMLQRISKDISAQTKHEDHLKHFEQLHSLFRSGVAPKVTNGLFQGAGSKGYNTRVDGREVRDWYGEEETTHGFDYYHGATLNLHWGFSETYCPDREERLAQGALMPSVLANALAGERLRGPNVMNMVWHNIGKYIFPWAGKSFERISPRKLSMFLDESADLAERYPDRVHALKIHLASAPHYSVVKHNQQNHWETPGRYNKHLEKTSWDDGMSDEDKAFWQQQADQHWVMGYNLQDKRILVADALMKIADMNYRVPEAVIQQASEASGSPFVRQGYAFLGSANQPSILPLNNGDQGNKQVFQFNYRYPLIGGPAPIGFCLDELVEIADGLYLGQLIYATALEVPFHSSVDPAQYKYQLFGYFLLLDDDWEQHRQAIKLDTLD